MLDTLTTTLLSREPTTEYREAVTRALDVPGCQVVPFCGGFLRDLRSILSGVPSIIVLPAEDSQQVEVSHTHSLHQLDRLKLIILITHIN